MFKQEIRTFSSKYPDGTLMFPGRWRCTFVLIAGSVWYMIGMEPFE